MYHGIGHRKLGKKTPHRLAMFSNMATSLIMHERIQTTVPKAKELRRIVERLITKAKGGTLGDRRGAHSFLRDDESVSKLFGDVATRFKDRKGGYTRVLRVAGTRHGDGAELAMIELVDFKLPSSKSKEQKKEDSAAKKKAAKEAKKAAPKVSRDRNAKVKGSQAEKKGANTMKSSGSRGT
jgi:large subunit ribosomal protein L17